jgi:hypothetical protein
LKGDLYVPHEDNRFCIEVKNYEKSPFSDKIFTNKTNYILQWWPKLIDQAAERKQQPLGTDIKPKSCRYNYTSWLDCYIMLAEEWLEEEKVEFLK